MIIIFYIARNNNNNKGIPWCLGFLSSPDVGWFQDSLGFNIFICFVLHKMRVLGETMAEVSSVLKFYCFDLVEK